MKRMILLALFLACGAAQAEEWVSIGSIDDKQTLVDVSSIRIFGDVRTFWVKGIVAPQSREGLGIYAGTWLSYLMSREAINCAEETYREEAKLAFFQDGRSVDMTAESLKTSWTFIPPESRAQREMKLVCAWTPK